MASRKKNVVRAKSKTPKRQVAGRPGMYSVALADEVCGRIMEGESLRKLTMDSAMPSRTTLVRWLATNEAFAKSYALACEIRADLMMEDLLEIADNPLLALPDAATHERPLEELRTLLSEAVVVARLQIDTRKWLMSKLKPKRFGDSASLRLGDSTPGERDQHVGFVIIPAKVPASDS
jgi:hypothetical protein